MQQQDILLNGTKAIVAMVNKKPLHEVTKSEMLNMIVFITNSIKEGDSNPNDIFMNLLGGYLMAFDELSVLEDLSLRDTYRKIVEAVEEESDNSSTKTLH